MATSAYINVGDVLNELDQICLVLETLFGPTQGKVLMENASGCVVVTNDGCAILNAITLDHPMARSIIQSCRNHHKQFGDGAKSMLLMIRSGLRYLDRNQLLSSASVFRNRISTRQKAITSLLWFKSHVLDNDQLKRWLLCNSGKMSSLNEGATFWSDVKLIGETPLRGKFSENAIEVLSGLVEQLLEKSCLKNSLRMLHCVSVCLKNFDLVLVEAPGPVVRHSHIVDGVLIRTWKGLDEGTVTGDSVFVQWDDAFTPETTRNVETVSTNQLTSWLNFPSKLFSEWVRRILTFNVSVIFYQGKALETLRTCCSVHDVTLVDCLPLDDFKQLTDALGVNVINDVTETIHRGMVSNTEVQEKVIGTNLYLLVRLREAEMPLHSLVICSPSPGLCSQYKNAVYNSLLLLRHWLEWSFGENPPELLSAVRGGGEMFLKLHSLMENEELLVTVTGNAFAGTEREHFKLAAGVVGEMLLEIPRIVHQNDTVTKDKTNRFLYKLQDSGSKCTTEMLHPFSSQLALLQNSVRAICETIRVDAVISIRKR